MANDVIVDADAGLAKIAAEVMLTAKSGLVLIAISAILAKFAMSD